MRRKVTSSMSVLAGLLLAASTAVPVAAQPLDSEKPWTTVGSTGTVDEADMQIVSLSGGAASASGLGVVDVRYGVVPVDGLFSPSDGIQMKVRYLDNGPDASVSAVLYAYNINTGAASGILALQSDSFPASGSYQTRSVSLCPGIPFDFVSNVYYVEVRLGKRAAGGLASLHLMQIGGTDC